MQPGHWLSPKSTRVLLSESSPFDQGFFAMWRYLQMVVFSLRTVDLDMVLLNVLADRGVHAICNWLRDKNITSISDRPEVEGHETYPCVGCSFV